MFQEYGGESRRATSVDMMFSVIVPVYNIENYIAEAVESVIRQQYSNYEILLIDDGSTDKSAALCDCYAAEYEKVSVIHRRNGGLSAARNTGILASKGDYLLFLDGDDWLLDDTLLWFHDKILAYNHPDVIFGGYKFYTKGESGYQFRRNSRFVTNEVLPQSRRGKAVFLHFLQYGKYLPPAWLKVCRRKYIIDHKLYFLEGHVHEDEEWTPRLFWLADSVAALDRHFYCYRYRENSIITTVKNTKKISDMASVIIHLMVFFASQPLNEKETTAIARFLSYKWRRLLTDNIQSGVYTKEELLNAYNRFFREETKLQCRSWLDNLPIYRRILPTLAIYSDRAIAYYLLAGFKTLRQSVYNKGQQADFV